MNPRFVFMLGAPRSGTTILHHLLNAHPFVRITNEQSVPELVSHINHWIHNKPQVSRMLLYEFLIYWYRKDNVHKQDVYFFGDKSPGSYGYCEVLRQHFPRMILIETIRDPYEIAASGLNRTDGGWKMSLPDHMKVTANTWDMHRKADQDGIHVIQVKLEELLSDPEKVMKNVCCGMDIPFGGGYKRDVLYHVGNIESKKGKLTEPQKNIVRNLLGDRIKLMGYDS